MAGKRKARSLGLKYHKAAPTELLLDIDTEHQWGQYQYMLPYLQRFLGVTVTKVTESRSKEDEFHKHVYLTIDQPLTLPERIALQAILGSDPMREWIALLRHWGGKGDDAVQLFEKGDEPCSS